MSGGKGSQQTGSATGSTTNPAGAALLPYAEGGWKEAARIAQDPTQYPNYVPPNPMTVGGYNDIYTIGQNLTQGFLPFVNNNYATSANNYTQLAGGYSGPQQTLDKVVGRTVNAAGEYAAPITDYAGRAVTSGEGYGSTIADYGNRAASLGQGYGSTIAGYANQAAANNNAGLNQLMRTATESPATNPYLQDMVNAALRPVSENYATSTAPTLDARFSAGGRYGSGAADVAAGSARDAFARNLGEISTGMYGKEYEFNRGLQQQAADLYSQRYNQGIGLGITGNAAASDAARLGLGLGISGNQAASEAARLGYGTGIQGQQAAGNLYNQGLQTAINAASPNLLAQGAGAAGQLSAVNAYPQLAGAQFLGPQAAIKAGDYFRGEELAPYNSAVKRVQDYMASLGNAPNAGSSTTSPIFGNPLTSAISGASGALGLGKELGLGGLFGSGGGAAATQAGLGALFPGATQTAAGLAGYAAIPELASSAAAFAPSAGKGAASFLPAIFSDRRLKEDDRVIGNIGDLPLHSFRYRGDPATRFGFMADEVAKVDPDAVLDTESGYKAVDYLRAARSAIK